MLNYSSVIFDKQFDQDIDIYVGVGKEGLAPGNIPRVMEVDANALAEKLRSSPCKTLHVYFDYLPQENHATITHQAVLMHLDFYTHSRKANNLTMNENQVTGPA